MELKRDLGTGAAISIVIGTVIGSGIFLVPHDMIARVHTPGMVFFIFVFGGCSRWPARSAMPNSPRPCPRPVANMPICARPMDPCGASSIVGRRCGSQKAVPSRRWLPAFSFT